MFWRDGDASLPMLHIPRKRKFFTAAIENSLADSDDQENQTRRSATSKFIKTVEDVDDIVEKKLQHFKESLLKDFWAMLCKGKSVHLGQSSKTNTSSANIGGCTKRPPRGLNSVFEGIPVNFQPPRSPSRSKRSCSKGSCSPHMEPSGQSFHNVCEEDTAVSPSQNCKNGSAIHHSDERKVDFVVLKFISSAL